MLLQNQPVPQVSRPRLGKKLAFRTSSAPSPSSTHRYTSNSAVHMQRAVGRRLRSIDEDDLTHLDRVLLSILRRMARERPPEAEPVLLAPREAVMQGQVRLQPEVRKLLWRLVERWHDLDHSKENPAVPASTNRLEGWIGRFKPRARLTRSLMKAKEGPPTSCS